MAVDICFHMHRKNHFHYVVFLDADGAAEVSGQQLLRFFDDERALFIMDYGDPRAEFTGLVTARALGVQDLAKAIEALKMYQGYVAYPANYPAQLKRATNRNQNAPGCHVEVTVAYQQ
jgi:hypothetical protein